MITRRGRGSLHVMIAGFGSRQSILIFGGGPEAAEADGFRRIVDFGSTGT